LCVHDAPFALVLGASMLSSLVFPTKYNRGPRGGGGWWWRHGFDWYKTGCHGDYQLHPLLQLTFLFLIYWKLDLRLYFLMDLSAGMGFCMDGYLEVEISYVFSRIHGSILEVFDLLSKFCVGFGKFCCVVKN
jgi:hypothetical protein